jgi:lipid A biosynthesis lauroyl/palmitoleoyl acyltransferase
MQHPFEWRFIYNPRFWPTWIGLGVLWLSSLLPYRLMLGLGRGLGILIWAIGAERRRITRTNLRLCFPQLPPRALRHLVLDSFSTVGMAVFESALTWWGSDRKFLPLLHTEGFEHVSAALQHGKGVILLGGHYATLEVGGRIMARQFNNLRPTYKSARDPLFNWVMIQMRIRRNGGIINSSNMREVLRALKQNMLIWYAPDQDFGLERSVFAPFMGVATATLTFTSRLAKASGAPVLPWYCERLPAGQGYRVRVGAPLDNFPSGDDVVDATVVNQVIEAQVRRTPEQYLWGHRRFKTRPAGEPLVYAPRRDSALRIYTLMNSLLAIPILLFTLWLARRNRDLAYLQQRLAIYPQHLGGPVDLWFHAASVGEVIGVLPVIAAIAAQHPTKKIILTTFTPTGGAIARQRLPRSVQQYYLPIDWTWCVKRFLHQARPGCAIIMETELWPNLHEYCHNRAIPVIVINGRLSQRSMRAPRWLRYLTQRTLEYTRHILVRSPTDYAHFRELKVDAQKLTLLGNLKFAVTFDSTCPPMDLGRPYVLAASTHADEEWQLARLWQDLGITSHLLVIAPRHPHRSKSICQQLHRTHSSVSVRSRNELITAQTQIYLADTFGELTAFIAGSEFVFMGGTLVTVGGHNILEVGAQGKAVVFGPHMENFSAERQLFLEQQAAVEVADAAALAGTIQHLLAHPTESRDIGQRALAVMRSQQQVLDRYLSQLNQLISALPGQA